MNNQEILGLTAMQLFIKSIESNMIDDKTSLVNRTLMACKEMAEGLLDIEKQQLQDAFRNSNFETYYKNRFYNNLNDINHG